MIYSLILTVIPCKWSLFCVPFVTNFGKHCINRLKIVFMFRLWVSAACWWLIDQLAYVHNVT